MLNLLAFLLFSNQNIGNSVLLLVVSFFKNDVLLHHNGNTIFDVLSLDFKCQNNGLTTKWFIEESLEIPFENKGKKVNDWYVLFLSENIKGKNVLLVVTLFLFDQ